jgi:phosphoribosylformimino-5-aminoimidazole carboxamide ribotide isomerase
LCIYSYKRPMDIYPAIDLRDGQVVRLEQGRVEAETIYDSDPVSVAKKFQAEGARHLHMVDLDGAFTGEFRNLKLVQSVSAATQLFIEMGGGLRTRTAIERVLEVGVSRAVIGTAACESLSFVRDMVARFGAERIAVGIDAKDGIVSTKGWTAPSKWTAPDLARAVAAEGVRTIIYTDIMTDGMFTGPNLPALAELSRTVPEVDLIASGGVASIEHITALRDSEARISGAIVGKAIYDEKITVADAIRAAKRSTS